jgi:hypothetical protein
MCAMDRMTVAAPIKGRWRLVGAIDGVALAVIAS